MPPVKPVNPLFMILLIAVTIYIWQKFAKLAEQKSLNKNRWAALGALACVDSGFLFFWESW